jgi:hypothetical protein
MMETAVLATVDDAQRLAKGFEPTLKEITDWGVELRAMQPGPLRYNLALERARDIKRYLDMVEASEFREQAKRLYDAHRTWLALLKRIRLPAEINLKLCTDIRAEEEVSRRRRIEADRRKREEEANRLASEQRTAEIDHLREIGKTGEAEAKAAAPIVPITVSVDSNAGKPEGEVIVEVWVPRVDERGDIVFSDQTAYLKWVAEQPAMHYLVKHNFGKLKTLLTNNRGMMQPPGLEIDHKFEPRTLKEKEVESDDL